MATLGQYNAAEMTAQEVFDAGAVHLLEQGKKSIRVNASQGESMCAYSGSEGLVCGAAPFVQNYTPDMETRGWGSLVKEYGQTEAHSNLIRALQQCHDTISPDNWKWTLDKIAVGKRLSPAILENYKGINDEG